MESDFERIGQGQIHGLRWDEALTNIFVFIKHYVPRHLFDLEKASKQQIAMLQAVQEGGSYFIVRAPRKGGKTILVAIIAVWLTLRDRKYRVFILSGSQNQAEWLYDYCKQILWPGGAAGAERRNFFGRFLLSEPMKRRTVYKEGGWIRYTAASSKQVNAPTADCIIMDEYVLIPQSIVEEAWPMVRGSEKIMRILLSTVIPGKEGTDSFVDLLEESKERGFEKFEWLAKDCPFLMTKAALRDTEVARKILSAEMFRTQYIGALPRGVGRIFPKTFIRRAFKALDPKNPGFLIDGTPYDPDNLEFRGEAKGAFDWGFDHDTAMLEGYRNLDHKIVLMKLIVENNTSATDWANRAEEDWKAYNIYEWLCDAAGAFQNREIEDRGLRVVRRPFQSKTEGKEWMIGVAYYWLQHDTLIIPDVPEFQPLKKQLLAFRRGADGKPVKKFDHASDAFILLLGGWDPVYYEESRRAALPPDETKIFTKSNQWETGRSSPEAWLPEDWKSRRDELTRLPASAGRDRSREMKRYPWERER